MADITNLMVAEPGAETHPVKAYFEDQIKAAEHFGPTASGMGRLARFWLDNGRPFVPTAATFKGRRREMKQCFQNATLEVLRDPSLTYVEGYVDTIIPIHHAWVLTPEGDILDPTLRVKGRHGGAPKDYWGIPFSFDYLMDTIRANGVYGLVDPMNKTFRNLIDGNAEGWKA